MKNIYAEINEIHSYYCEQFKLGNKQKNDEKRVEFLKKCWKVGE